MEQNIVVGIFEVESEAYQALTQLKQNPGDDKSLVTQAILVKKENGALKALDSFDTGKETANDTLIGGLAGGLVGILGGPIGVLLMGSYGALVGSLVDAGDALDNASLIEQIADKLNDSEVAIIGLANEEDEAALDGKLNQFKVTILRYDADVVAEEVENAQMVADAMASQARRELRKKKFEEGKEKVKNWFKAEEDKFEEAAEEKAEVAFENATVGESTDVNYD